jgi:RNA polymerase sigma-70 factor, ECF subfamily
MGAMIWSMTESRGAGGEAGDFEALYARHYRDVFRYSLALTRRVEDAEDVASEVFERGLRSGRSNGATAPSELAWLLLIARRIVIDRARRQRLLRWLPLSIDPVAPRAHADPDRVEFWLWFDQLADVLTSRQREVLLLRYQADLSDADVGRVLGISEAGVRSLASRAVAALRQHPELLR